MLLFLSLAADSAFAWSPPPQAMRQWRLYQYLGDLDAVAPTPAPLVKSFVEKGAGEPKIAKGLPISSASSFPLIRQVAEQPRVAEVLSPAVGSDRLRTLIIQQTTEPELIPAQQLTYAPISQTVLRAIQNIRTYNIISVLQSCGSLCFQNIDIDALALSMPVQSLFGLSSNTGDVTQTGTFAGSGAGLQVQNVVSHPQAQTDIGSQQNIDTQNALQVLQVSGSGASQNAFISAGAFTFPTSLIQGDSSNTTAIHPLP